MTKNEVVKMMTLIESVYPDLVAKNETIQYWFDKHMEHDFLMIMDKLKAHIRCQPYPPTVKDLTGKGSNTSWNREYVVRKNT